MSSLISSQKRGGNGHLRSSDNSQSCCGLHRRSAIVAISLLTTLGIVGLLATGYSGKIGAQTIDRESLTSKAAAESCRIKMKRVEDFDLVEAPKRGQTTKFSEEEANAYLSEDLDTEANPSLRDLRVTFKKDSLQAVATIDFDRLEMTSDSIFAKIFSMLFSGLHTLTARGRLISWNGEAYFELEQALFDDKNLPKPLVEEIITAVGLRQNPPFDPLQPSELLYKIDRIEVQPGYMIVYQKPVTRSPSN